MGQSYNSSDVGKVVRSKKPPYTTWDVDGATRDHPTRIGASQVRLRSRETKRVSWVGVEHFWENFEELLSDHVIEVHGAVGPVNVLLPNTIDDIVLGLPEQKIGWHDIEAGVPVSSIDHIRARIESLLSDAVSGRQRPIMTDAERVDLSSAQLSIRNGLDRLSDVLT